MYVSKVIWMKSLLSLKIIIFMCLNLLYSNLVFAESDIITELRNNKDRLKYKMKSEYLYFAGISELKFKKVDAADEAWFNALYDFALVNFPELIELKSKSEESLNQTIYNRIKILHLEKIDWSGLEEVTEVGSPLTYPQSGNYYKVARVIRWSKKKFNAAKLKIKNAKSEVKYTFPLTPEKEEIKSKAAAKEILYLEKINQVILDKNKKVRDILKRIKCGFTYKQLVNILGEPVTKEFSYYHGYAIWGTYKVEFTGDYFVKMFVFDLGFGKKVYICN